MNMIIQKRLILILFIFNSLVSSAGIYWGFNKNQLFTSNDSTIKFNHYGIRDFAVTSGVIGNAIRTDGYSTYLSYEPDYELSLSAVSGWFALESFPTDTAAFFGIRNSVEETIAVCTDRYGNIMIGIGNNESFKYISTNGKIETFKWIHICLENDPEGPQLHVNGEKLILKQTIPFSKDNINYLQVGRDFRTKQIGIFDTTLINGLIDEFRVHSQPLDSNYTIVEFQKYGKIIPELAIPSSRFVHDFNRPKYHLLPAANWTNETHGLLYHKKRYHIFNQKNASNLFLGQINWGHFSSPDLINWMEHKPAITPEVGYDKNGIWSGHAVISDEGLPVIFYTTGGDKMGVGIATPCDEKLMEWKKHEKNPVIYGQPEGFTRTDLRDPYVWKEDSVWYMIIGFGVVDESIEKGALLLYKSYDLINWNFIHTMFEGNPELDNSGIFWEMPIFFKIAGKYVLLVNKIPQRGEPARAFYWVGDFVNERFIPDSPVPRNLEVINRLLSPSISYDSEGRLTTIAIIPDEISSHAAYMHGWTHLYSIPRVWELNNGKIEQSPHPALKKLRNSKQIINAVVNENSPLLISQGTHQFEFEVNIDSGESDRYGFIIHKNPDNSEFSKIYYDVATNEIVVDQQNSSIKEGIPLRIRRDTFPLDSGKPENFHIFIDGSVVEVFINNKEAFTTRIFPYHFDSNNIEIFTDGGEIGVEGEYWKLNGAKIKMDF